MKMTQVAIGSSHSVNWVNTTSLSLSLFYRKQNIGHINFLAAEVARLFLVDRSPLSLAALPRLLSVARAHPGSRLRTRRDRVTLIPSVIFQVITQCTHVGSRISVRT
jgi:hypothetical protein